MSIIEDEEKIVGIKTVGGSRCPFRGYPFRYHLDERCPTAITVLMVEAEDREAVSGKDGMTWPKIAVQVPIPVLKADTYCHDCVNNFIREKEAGLHISDRQPVATKKLRRQRRRAK